jgi:multidrug resistance efflux pump
MDHLNSKLLILPIITAVLFGVSVPHAAAFEPARVADQANVTIDMLEEELEQFVQQGKAIQAKINAPQLQQNLSQAQADLRRAEELYKSKSISFEELRTQQTAVDQIRKSIEINKAGEQASLARAEVAKFKILEQGQPGLNSYILQAAVSQVQYLTSLQSLLARAKEKAENQLELAKFLETNARDLVEAGAFPRELLEQRTLARKQAETAVGTTVAELEALTPALDAAKRTRTKLQGN